ncbi:peptide ABC transporter substrate-binding protein [Holzapfeliella sp. He02]|uniref:Peptide ABC transporter substrate-binding protein n=1 Tax=Holzapfeliella saturejae TaxID=3082953 RepID=A0ABU8SE98_9LACO
MNLKRIITATILSLSLGFVLVGCSTGNSSETTNNNQNLKSLNFVAQQELPTADLSLATDTVSYTVLNNVYEGLYRQDKDNNLILAGAKEKGTVSEDSLTYNFKLNPEAKWSNGDAVTANDYVYSWRRTVNPKTASEYAYLFDSLKNAKEIKAGEKEIDELGIHAISDYELQIELSSPVPYFERLLTLPSFFPQNQSVVEKYGKDYALKSETAVYNGPFVLEGFDGPGTDTKWTYKKNDNYFDKDNVKVDIINVNVVKESATALNLFQNNQADDIVLTGELAQQNQNHPAYHPLLQATTQYLNFNQIEPTSPFRNENLRKAIATAIDRSALTTSILGNGSIPATGLVPKNLMKSPTGIDFTEAVGDSYNKFDAEKAKQYFAKAKEELKIDNFEFSILSSDTDSAKKVIEYLQNIIEQTLPGMKVNLTPVPFSVRLERSRAGNFDVSMVSYGADYLDASTFTDLLRYNNSGRWTNDTYTALLESAATTNVRDPQKRFDDLVSAEKLELEVQACAPLYQVAEAHMINPKIKNFVSHPAGAKFDYKWLEID